MRLEHPAALALAMLIPLLLFTRRRRSRVRLPVANLHLWTTVSPTDVAALARRLRRHWLLILQASFLAAAALSVAGPKVAAGSGSVALLLDTSISMGARHEGSTTRLDVAQAQAMSLVERLPGRTRLHIIAADSKPRPIATLAASDPAVSAAIDSVRVTDAPADLATAIQYARAAGVLPQNIYVFSDADATRMAGIASTGVEWSTVGQATDNAAITGLSARRPPQTTGGARVLVSLSNRGGTPVNGILTLARDGSEVARLPVSLAARTDSAHAFTLSPADGLLTARLEDNDAVGADNVRRLVVPAPSRIRVLLVSQDAFFLEKALAVHPGTTVTRSATADHDVIVCDGCSALPGGSAGVLLIPPSTQPPPAPVALVQVAEHPLAEGLNLDGTLAVTRVRDGMPEGSTVVARAGDEAALVAYETAGRRVLEMRVDPDRGPLPLSTAFPVLIANALEWLARHNPTALSAGDLLQWHVPAERQPPVVLGPDDGVVPSAFRDGVLSVADTRTAGVYRIRLDSGEQSVAVNPAVLGEADLTAIAAPARAAAPNTDATGGTYQDLTVPVALVALLLLALEWRYRLIGRLA